VFVSAQPDVFEASGAQTNAWADFDNDGDLDLFVGFRGRPNRLYRNDLGTFTDIAPEQGLADEEETRAAAWGDFDNDGDPDLYVGFAAEGVGNRLYRNDGGRFVDVANELGVDRSGTTRQPVFLDYDGDDDLDLFVAFRDRPNSLFRNDGDIFTDVTDASGIGDPRRTVGVAWFDMDGDADLDAFVANQNGDEDGFYRNLGDGTFEDVAAALGMNQPGRPENLGSVGTAVSDYDNDGDLDLFVASYGPDVLWQNQGDGTFVNVASGTPLAGNHHSVSAAWGDFDNDGWVDLYVDTFLSGEPEARDYLFRNVGGVFTEVTPTAMVARGASHGIAWADFDADGDLDVSLANNDATGSHPLYQNDIDPVRSQRALQIAIVNNDGAWTRPGATVTLRREMDGYVSSRLVDTGGGYSSQGMTPVHFGLPPGGGPFTIDISWFEAGERRTSSVAGVMHEPFRNRWVVLQLGVTPTR
jgi:VCBS repeat protein/ASPIC/UnbV protein